MESKAHYCTFYLGNLWFAIPAERVQEELSSPAITPVPLAPCAVAGLANLRGQIITVIDLWRRLGFSRPRAVRQPALVVVRNDRVAVGLLVDQAGEVVDVPEEAWEPAPSNLPPATGALVPNVGKFRGSLLHVLELDRVLQCAGQEGLPETRVKEAGHCAD